MNDDNFGLRLLIFSLLLNTIKKEIYTAPNVLCIKSLCILNKFMYSLFFKYFVVLKKFQLNFLSYFSSTYFLQNLKKATHTLFHYMFARKALHKTNQNIFYRYNFILFKDLKINSHNPIFIYQLGSSISFHVFFLLVSLSTFL